MPWKNQGGGPWGSGPKGPWGSGPQSVGPRPPDLARLPAGFFFDADAVALRGTQTVGHCVDVGVDPPADVLENLDLRGVGEGRYELVALPQRLVGLDDGTDSEPETGWRPCQS